MPELQYRKISRDFGDGEEKANRRKGICATKFCRKRVYVHRRNSKGKKCLWYEKFCPKCKARKWKKKNIERYAWVKLKSNASRRGIPFHLSLEDWQAFCRENNFLQGVGKQKESLSVDRRDPRIGYVFSNLQVLTISENSSKSDTIPEDEDPF